LTRLLKLSVILTCNPEEKDKEEFDPESRRWIKIYCEKFDSCDQCLERNLRLIEKKIGPEFRLQKFTIEEIIDLRDERK